MDRAGKDTTRVQRRQAVRTAWVLAVVAALIFIAFILSGVLGS
jgi:preprotein translocase subunit SecE